MSEAVAPPLLWMLTGPAGAGKTTYYRRVVAAHLRAPLVDAERIARGRWPRHHRRHAEEARTMAAATRAALVRARKSFVAEVAGLDGADSDLATRARRAGYVVWVTLVGVGSPELAVARLGQRARTGGGLFVTPDEVRARYAGLRERAAGLVSRVDRLAVVDNGEGGRALRDVLLFEHGRAAWRARDLPDWATELFADWLENQPQGHRGTERGKR